MQQRTRIKMCGLTRAEDVAAVVAAGADAIGFVFYPKSELLAGVPPFVGGVGLFVNAGVDEVLAAVRAAPLAMLQFHGDETARHSAELAGAAQRPFMQVFRVKPDTTGADLIEYEQRYRAASTLFSGLLLDTHVDAFGGAGKVFDWSLIPKELAPRVVLSGGLSVQNATDAVLRVRPYAVDVSSGIEAAKGIKDAHRILAFVEAIRAADAILDRENSHDSLA